MHHNARDGGGYGVDVNGGAYATIVGNVFDFNRHAVAATAWATAATSPASTTCCRAATRRRQLADGGYYNQHFDVHGEAGGGYGGPAGDVLRDRVQHDPRRAGLLRRSETRPAFMLRGTRGTACDFNGNVAGPRRRWTRPSRFKGVDPPGLGEATSPGRRPSSTPAATATTPTTPRSSPPATSTATAAPMSSSPTAPPGSTRAPASGPGSSSTPRPSARRSWASPTSTTTAVTDVLYRDPRGNLGYLKSGRGRAGAPHHRAGADEGRCASATSTATAKTDIFYTRNGQWQIWYGSTRTWTARGPRAHLRAAVRRVRRCRGNRRGGGRQSGWAYSSGSTGRGRG